MDSLYKKTEVKRVFKYPENLSPIGQANLKGVIEGEKVYKAFPETAKGGMEINRALLMKILEDNKDTEYGRKYGFAQIKTVEEYQKRVPLTTYADYKPYIYRMTEEGEQNLLTAYPVIHYSKTSGTTGDPKRIPYTDAMAGIHGKYGIAYQDGLLAQKIGYDWVDGKKISLLESGITTLRCGDTFGSFSGKTILAARDSLGYLFTSPVEAMIPEKGTDTRYLYTRYALMEENVTGLFCTMDSFVVEFMRYIEKYWPMLVYDIREGTIDESIAMHPEVRASLLAKLEPMPERADALEAIFTAGFDEPTAPKIWPRMQYMVGVGTGAYAVYAKMLRQQYLGEQVAQYRVGLFASEGHFSITMDVNDDRSVLVPDSMFYEFLPLGETDLSKCVTMEQVQVGQAYEIITTNLAGLYRYRMQEAVRVVGWFHNTPVIEYMYRLNQTVSIMGEKTSEPDLNYAVVKTAQKLQFHLVDYSVWADIDGEPFFYRMFIEADSWPEGLTVEAVRQELEKNLGKANPSLGDKLEKGILGKVVLSMLPEGTYQQYRNQRVEAGAAAMQMKPPHVLIDRKQYEFFMAAANEVSGHGTV